MAMGAGEFEVPWCLRMAEDHAVKPVVVRELRQYLQAQTVAPEGQQRRDVVGRARDADDRDQRMPS